MSKLRQGARVPAREAWASLTSTQLIFTTPLQGRHHYYPTNRCPGSHRWSVGGRAGRGPSPLHTLPQWEADVQEMAGLFALWFLMVSKENG